MLLIRKNQTNTLVFTLNEKKTLESPNYLLELKNDLSKGSYYCLLPSSGDTSDYQDRFNRFSVDEPDDINLPLAGYYSYSVYEQTGTTLNPSLTTSKVETGKALVVFSGQSVTSYSGNNNTYIVYNP